MAKKYEKINFKPTDGMKKAAQAGLDMRQEYGRGGTAVGIARARDIVNGKTLSPSTVRRMFSFFSRHEVDKKAKGFSPGEEGYPSNGRIAWNLWGGDAGFTWSKSLVERMKKEDAKSSITVYDRERELGLAEVIVAETKSSLIAELNKEVNFAESSQKFYKYDGDKEWEMKFLDEDLMAVNAVLVSAVWNKNDDVFSQEETWEARNTPVYKSVNIGHKGREGVGTDVVGVIVSAFPVDSDFNQCYSEDGYDCPDSFKHIIVGVRVWDKYFPTHSKYIKDGINAGNMFVSMECMFTDFGYALREEGSNEVMFLERNEITAWLTQHLRRYGGEGKVKVNGKEYLIGRWLIDITFSGMGFVEIPANPDSFVFTDYLSFAEQESFSENISKNIKNSVFLNKGEILLWS